LAMRDAAGLVTYPYFIQRLAERRGPGTIPPPPPTCCANRPLPGAGRARRPLPGHRCRHPSLDDRGTRRPLGMIVEGANTYSPIHPVAPPACAWARRLRAARPSSPLFW
jgi:hypothetical protein